MVVQKRLSLGEDGPFLLELERLFRHVFVSLAGAVYQPFYSLSTRSWYFLVLSSYSV